MWRRWGPAAAPSTGRSSRRPVVDPVRPAERGTKYRVAGFLLLAGFAVLLTAGPGLFAEHAPAAGRRFGVTAPAVGLVLAVPSRRSW